jgi:hypothetical protein
MPIFDGFDKLSRPSQIESLFATKLDSQIPPTEELEPISVNQSYNANVYRIPMGEMQGNILKVISKPYTGGELTTHILATRALSSPFFPLPNIPRPVKAGTYDSRLACVETFVPNAIGLSNIDDIRRLPIKARLAFFNKTLQLLIKIEEKSVIPVDLGIPDLVWDGQKSGIVDFGGSFIKGFNPESQHVLYFKKAMHSISKLGDSLIPEINIDGFNRAIYNGEVTNYQLLRNHLSRLNPELITLK